MKYCSGCGKELLDNVKFCSRCGGNSFSALPIGDMQSTASTTVRDNLYGADTTYAQDLYGGDAYSPRDDYYSDNDETVISDRSDYGQDDYYSDFGADDYNSGRDADGYYRDDYRRDGYRDDRYRDDYRDDRYRDDGYRDDYRDDGYRGDGYRGDGYRDDGYRDDRHHSHHSHHSHHGDGRHHRDDYQRDAYGNRVDAYGNRVDEYGNPIYEEASEDDGKKPLMIAMISLAGVLVVLCIVLVVVFFKTPSTTSSSTSTREIPTVEEAVTEAPQVEETLTVATTAESTATTAAESLAAATNPPANNPPVTRPPATKRPASTPTTKASTTKAVSTTKSSTTTTKSSTTTTKSSTTTTTGTTSPVAITGTSEIISLYSSAVSSVRGGAAGYSVKQVRTLDNVNLVDNDSINSLLKTALSNAFTKTDSAEKISYSKGSSDAKTKIPAWNLSGTSNVTSATCSISNGNYVVRIQLKDEQNPSDGSALSQVSDMINSYDSIDSMVRSALSSYDIDVGDATFDLLYSGYTIEAVITADGKLVSVRHSDTVTVTTHNLTIEKFGVTLDLNGKSFSWNSSKDYTDFNY